MEKPNKKRMITAGILLTLAILSITGVLTSLQRIVILPPAENYVEASQEKALTAFITVSAVKGLIAVVEGSDVVGIEVGDVVQPLYDAIDITWKILALSLGALYAIEILLGLSGVLGKVFLSSMFILALVTQFTKKTILRKAAVLTGALGLFFFVAVPITLAVSGSLSEGYSKPVRDRFDLSMTEFQESFQARLDELKVSRMEDFITVAGGSVEWHGVYPDISFPSISFPKYYIVQAILADMSDMVKELPELLIRTGVTWLLDVIIIPVGLLFLLYRLAILFTESLFGGAKADRLEKTLKKYLEKKTASEQ
ncbi:MAG TPA: hypothetical protein PLM22_09170 [Candidatus Sabulitectum sp.]|nr:hypothetical protein [Candidatus Sabulitectum sp.]HPF31540.1 hypothetical protein [Candidatus Sabulitectum sp.]HPJ29090.1 hypothetical protein [Candidatus Sabulitectum sp.]HPR22606.1 hypothetical protein [Candidatus Sabulitectum sp.]